MATDNQKMSKTMRDNEFAAIWREAEEAGLQAGQMLAPVPMVVGSPSTPFGSDVDPSKPTYYVEDGVCGFAWINVRPATSAFCKWWKKKIGEETGREVHRAYEGGYTVKWVHEFNQSMQKKYAYAKAFAEVLRKNGIKATAYERLD